MFCWPRVSLKAHLPHPGVFGGGFCFPAPVPQKRSSRPSGVCCPPSMGSAAWEQPSWVSPGAGVGGEGGARAGFRPGGAGAHRPAHPGRVREAAPVLRVPGEVLLRLLPLVFGVLHSRPDPPDVGLPEVLRQRLLQTPAGHHMARAHLQPAARRPRPVREGQGAGQSEGEPPFPGRRPAAERALRQKVDVSPRLRGSREPFRVASYPAAEAYASETSRLGSFQSPIPRSYLYA